jgi:hypothetical protein
MWIYVVEYIYLYIYIVQGEFADNISFLAYTWLVMKVPNPRIQIRDS